MIPAVIDDETSPPGEVELFALLRDEAPESWAVLHSLDLPRHVRQVEGELDFLVLIPGGAAVCLEVKSHQRVLRDTDGLWRLGQDSPTARSPFRQAADAMYSLKTKVSERPALASVPFVSAVAFPRCRFELSATEWDSFQVFDEAAITNHGITHCLRRIADGQREKLGGIDRAAWFDPDAGEPTEEQCEQIVRLVRPRFEQSRSPKARRAEAAGEIRRYTEEQFRALDFHATNPRVAFTGGAGTGKTLVALELARRSVLAVTL